MSDRLVKSFILFSWINYHTHLPLPRRENKRKYIPKGLCDWRIRDVKLNGRDFPRSFRVQTKQNLFCKTKK